ncbi:MAG: acyl-CoA dehydrogenase, partial [Actinobacteria bacterium]|nr:acyl-CoA dehydrogenase [Actinomycetota bacterium]
VDEIVVVARVSGTTGDEGVAAFIVPAQTANPVPVAALDATRSMATLDLNGIRVSSDRLLGEPGPESAAALRKVIDESITALAIETVGTSQSIFDLTLNYAKEREQFGVPIGSFQAIKHRFADMLVLLERARATSYFAALTVAEDDHRRPLAVATAKAAAGDCQRKIGREGIQIHGGIGYTWEHNMHIYVRRVLTDAQLLGSADEQRARIADLLFV